MDRFPASFRVLSREERERALRFRFERDQNEFVAAHGALRALLARYTGQEPHLLELRRDGNGKPILGGRSDGDPPRFSMSYSGGLALYGVASDAAIGVDIELVDRKLLDEDTLKWVLSPLERAALDALTPAVRTDSLFRFWTLKEAYLKARGGGLAILPSALDVSAARAGRPIPFAGGATDEDGVPWTLSTVPVPSGYSAAVAYGGIGSRIVCRLFDDRVAEPVEMDGSA
jgi:4'-phosphopantetheinyl transferase